MCVSLELLSAGIYCQRRLASQFGYLQMVVELTNGVLADNIALLLIQGQGERFIHILTYQPACRAIATEAGQA